MFDYQFTKKTNLIDDTMQLLCHLSLLDFYTDDEVDEVYLQTTQAIIKEEKDNLWAIVNTLNDDLDYILSDDFTDADRAFYMSTLRSLRKLALGKF